MDAFYAAVEQRDNPELRGKPVAVGGQSARSVVSTASYEARKFGVRSAMSMVTALKICPQLIVVPHRFEAYVEVSQQIREIFASYTDLIEPLSLDEAFLDVTGDGSATTLATPIAAEIRKRIFEETDLTASAGVSYNKFLAKLASDMRKPDGMTVIPPEFALRIIDKTKIEKFFGVGPATAKKMHRCGIFTGKDLRNISLENLTRLFGKQGKFFFDISRGIDERPVNPSRIRKSVGTERTFEKDLTTRFQRIAELYRIEIELMERIAKAGFKGHTLTLKVTFGDFTRKTRSKTLAECLDKFEIVHKYAKILLRESDLDGSSIRLLGLSVSNENDNKQDEAYQTEIPFT